MVLHTLGPYFILFLPQKWSILWQKVPILGGRMTNHVVVPSKIVTLSHKMNIYNRHSASRPPAFYLYSNIFPLFLVPFSSPALWS